MGSFKQMIAFMDVAMAGRVAEELIFGKENITSGASSDIMSASSTARAMVNKQGGARGDMSVLVNAPSSSSTPPKSRIPGLGGGKVGSRREVNADLSPS